MDVPAEARKCLETAFLELAEAHLIWGCWADGIRQQAEQRLGMGPADEEVQDDPGYSAALDAGRPYSNMLIAASNALAEVDSEYAQALKENRLAASVRERRMSEAKSAAVRVHPRRAPPPRPGVRAVGRPATSRPAHPICQAPGSTPVPAGIFP